MSASTVFNGFKTTCKRLFGDIPNLNEISQFLMILSAIKSMNQYPYKKKILEKGEEMNLVMHKYSYSRLQKVFEIQEFEFVFRYIYDNHYNRISTIWGNKDDKAGEVYIQMLNTWIAKFSEYSF